MHLSSKHTKFNQICISENCFSSYNIFYISSVENCLSRMQVMRANARNSIRLSNKAIEHYGGSYQYGFLERLENNITISNVTYGK